jgi:aryl-alcohol dehydrogenase-like predicted oxidoreductase
MEHTKIANLPQKIVRIGLGTWSIGGLMWGGADPKVSVETILRAIEMGINFIDTAPIYGLGHAEEVVGAALQISKKRDFITLSTKAGIGWRDFKPYRDCRRKIIYREIENSLYRLRTDYIDLYHIHWPDPLTEIEETATTCRALLDQGKVRAIGLSNFSVKQIEEFKKYCPVHALQSAFNLFERKIEKEEIPFCLNNKISLLGYGPLCRGLLSGDVEKYTTLSDEDLRKTDPKFQEPLFSDYLSCTQKLTEWVKDKHQKSLYALAVRWVLDHNVNIALVGARKPDQLEKMKEVWGWKLDADDFKEIDQIIDESISTSIEEPFQGPPNRPDNVA